MSARAEDTREPLVLASLFAVMLVGELNVHLMSPLLPAIARDFSVSVGVAGAAVTAYAAGAGLFAVLVGPLSDVYGRTLFLRLAVAVFAVCFLFTAVAATFPVLLALRFLSGAAAGAVSTTVTTYAADVFPYARRGRAFGIIATASFVALSAGVPLGARLAGASGWRTVFVALLAGTVVVWPLTWLLRDDRVRLRGGRGLPREHRMPHARTFIRLYRTFLADRSTLFGLLTAFFVSSGLLGFVTYLGAWLTDHRGVPISSVGLLFISAAAASLVGAPLAGVIADHIGKRPVAVAANLVLGTSVLVFPLFDWAVPVFVGFAMVALAAAFRQGPLSALITELVETEHRGAYVAVRNSASQLGIAMAALVGGRLYEAWGFAGVTSFAAMMSALAAVCILGIREPEIIIGGHR